MASIFADQWRARCPQGHASLRTRVGDGYYCRRCVKRYTTPPVDAREVEEFPVETQDVRWRTSE